MEKLENADGSLFLRVPSGVAQASGRLGRPDCLEWLTPKIFPAASKPKIRDSGPHSDRNLFGDRTEMEIENSSLTELFL